MRNRPVWSLGGTLACGVSCQATVPLGDRGLLPPFDELTVANLDPGDAAKRGWLGSGGKSQSLPGVLSGGGPPDDNLVTVCQDGIESDMEFRECGEQRLVLADPKFFGAA